MPSEDMTGPRGAGPLTGRGLGPCGTGLGFRRGFRRYGMGFGRGFGRGGGVGFRAGFYPQGIQPQVITEAEEKKFLQEDLEALKREMAEVQKRLKEFK